MVETPFACRSDIEIPPTLTLMDLIDQRAAAHGDDVVYRYADYSRALEGEYRELTWSEFQLRVCAVAARVQQVSAPGDRVAVLAPHGLDYVVAFFGAIAAGAIAVPLFTPDEPGHTDRLHAVLADSAPAVILTTVSAAAGVRDFYGRRPGRKRPRIIAVDAVPTVLEASWRRPDATADAIAYLQYTSGSTRTPAGVEITHRAVATNLLQLADALGLDADCRGVSWLPLFHDMGLLCVILPMVCGRHITLLSPSAFIRRPYRWIKELGATTDGGGVFSAAPNFAFEYAAERGRPAPGTRLDLSKVIGLINGSEPVTVSAMRKFTEAFAPYGLASNAIKPCYGMAEATVFVSATQAEVAARVVHVDRERLNAGRMVPVTPEREDAVAQVSCGYLARAQWAVITDPASGRERPDGTVGEIWLHGDNLGVGYWNRPDETIKTFRNRLVRRLFKDSHAEGAPADARWLRTGDFGAYLGGQLYVTGRVKDLVIINGRNHYPQDLEHSAQNASTALRPGFIAAFSVPANELPRHATTERPVEPDDTSDQLIIVAERGTGIGKLDPDLIASRVRAALSSRHGVLVRDLLLVPAGSIPRTSSGKIARRACRAAYLDGTLGRAAVRR
ncbi:long-chain-fatty-acid--AMP ligase FadD32 [Nocardia sp. CDC153]|uniref:long-chain-fatty-acid--AMP ligase FadD32 n=1 Tax=Nocardia sp. CDC153 TaxID=3112167 RepID=UPI002DB7276B|nr:long-chain-fatty-acid--AMP ligase FadD32 [Nocardia sp. CDC153]MEC3952786.1 long-chain-fatty-acid--AMP ligase FadD32 [Nocardia sp. CDC153]